MWLFHLHRNSVLGVVKAKKDVWEIWIIFDGKNWYKIFDNGWSVGQILLDFGFDEVLKIFLMIVLNVI